MTQKKRKPPLRGKYDILLSWLKSRQGGVGSSDSPVLALKKVFDSTPLTLYIDKQRIVTMDEVLSSEGNPNFRRGHTYEPLGMALFEDQTGIKAHFAQTDQEKCVDFQVWHPQYPFLFADFDGLSEDGWVLEAKSPMQRIASAIKSHGLKDYYQIQAQHLAGVANACDLPYLGAKYKGKIKGTRMIIYEPENVCIQIYELPFDPVFFQAIVDNAREFMECVNSHTPPSIDSQKPSLVIPSKGGTYEEVSGAAWSEAIARLKLAQERVAVAAKMAESTKQTIKDAMAAAGLEAVSSSGWKFSNKMQAGRTSFDKTLLQADFPDLDLERYSKKGNPFETFRSYGPKDHAAALKKVAAEAQMLDPEESLDRQLLTIGDELAALSTGQISGEEVIEIWDELRDRAELYQKVLSIELSQMTDAIDNAAEAVMRTITGKGKDDKDGKDKSKRAK